MRDTYSIYKNGMPVAILRNEKDGNGDYFDHGAEGKEQERNQRAFTVFLYALRRVTGDRRI